MCATANFLLRYTKKETDCEMKDGQEEAREAESSHDEELYGSLQLYSCTMWM